MDTGFLPYRKKLHQKIGTSVWIMAAFALLIGIGAVLLSTPLAARDGQWGDPMTGLFTATSATCVTGLVLVDTYTHWSAFGQAVILCLIQIGGLGFMTIASMVSFALRRTITLKERMVMTASLNVQHMAGIVGMTRRILLGTLLFEGVGAVVLSACFIPEFGVTGGIWRGIFHSVSAFCNAGFDLMGVYGPYSSLTPYLDNPVVLFTIMALIVLGGLGFFVWNDIAWNRRKNRRLTVHSKLVLIMTAVLIFGGALLIFVAERNNPATLGGVPEGETVWNAAFQSVTLRTAGFNTLNQDALTGAGKAVSILLMFIGGCPGSTAGGVKVVTVGVLLVAAAAVCRGKSRVFLFHRMIPAKGVLNAIALFMVGILAVAAGSFAICLVDGVSYTRALYEAVSAFATVGTTTGITPSLSTVSQIILMALMYVGRVGILTLSIGIMSRKGGEPRISYPEEAVMIG